MLTTHLGNTGLTITKLAYGTADFRGAGAYSGRPFAAEDAGRLLNAVLDAGINYLDTSPDYGQCEDVIGQYASHRRRDFVLATKFGCLQTHAPDHDANHEWTVENFRRNLERSLRRLRTDVIDVWQMHTPVTVEQVREEDVRAAAEDAKAAGKIRVVGVSADRRTSAGFRGWRVYETLQTSYSLLERRDEALLAEVHDRGVGTIVRGSVAQGDPAHGGGGMPKRWQAWHDAQLDELLPEGETRTGFLLRYALAMPSIDTLIVGMRNEKQLRENLAAAALGPLPVDLCDEARRRLDVPTAPPPQMVAAPGGSLAGYNFVRHDPPHR